jgi:TRAP-type C4-dicarboxylate transport system substrate-binding protein
MKLRRTLLTAAAAASAAARPGPAHRRPGAELQVRIPHVAGGGHRLPLGQGRRDLGQQGEGKNQGRINIKLYPGVSLMQGDQTREFGACARA